MCVRRSIKVAKRSKVFAGRMQRKMLLRLSVCFFLWCGCLCLATVVPLLDTFVLVCLERHHRDRKDHRASVEIPIAVHQISCSSTLPVRLPPQATLACARDRTFFRRPRCHCRPILEQLTLDICPISAHVREVMAASTGFGARSPPMTYARSGRPNRVSFSAGSRQREQATGITTRIYRVSPSLLCAPTPSRHPRLLLAR